MGSKALLPERMGGGEGDGGYDVLLTSGWGE